MERKKRNIKSKNTNSRTKAKVSRKKKKTKINKIKKLFLLIFVVLFLSLGFKLVSYYNEINYDITKVSKPITPSIIYDKDKNVVMEVKSKKRQEWVKIEDIPDRVKNAFISIEDKRFYKHHGIDFIATSKAVVKALIGQSSGGGSGITQQLVKNVYLTPEQTMERKFKEAVIALEIEQKLTKDQILEAYLNNIYFSEGIYGVKVAAKDFFGKELSELTIRESATLAAIINSPEFYNPRVAKYINKDMEDLNKRVNNVIFSMHDLGYISDDEANKAYDDPLFVKKEGYKPELKMYKYPQFTEYVLTDAINTILDSRNLSHSARNFKMINEELETSGYKIISTIDSNIQNNLQTTIQNWSYYPRLVNGKNPEVASVILENGTGNIVGMVGSRKEPSEKNSFNRAVYSRIPVASIIKPLSIYTPAYDLGGSPGSIIFNAKEKIDGYDEYDPYPDGVLGPEGFMTYRESLNHSYNIPAARILVDRVGFKNSVKYLNNLGLKGVKENGGELVMGTTSQSVLDMAGAYQTLANNGEYIKPNSILEIRDSNDNLFIKKKTVKRQVFSKEATDLITDSMIDVAREGSGQNAQIQNFDVAVKTGTHNDKSITFAGYSPYYTSVAWLGDDKYTSFEGSPLSQDTLAYVWGSYMNKIHYGLQPKSFVYSDEITKVNLSNITGELVTERSGIRYGYHTDLISRKTPPNNFNREKIVNGKKFVFISKGDDLYKINHAVIREKFKRIIFE